jgi:hypothetical protein
MPTLRVLLHSTPSGDNNGAGVKSSKRLPQIPLTDIQIKNTKPGLKPIKKDEPRGVGDSRASLSSSRAVSENAAYEKTDIHPPVQKIEVR